MTERKGDHDPEDITMDHMESFADLIRDQVVRNDEFNTNDDNIVENFYRPILAVARSYDRSTGAFSVGGLKALATSLVPFIRNALKHDSPRPIMRIVASHDISDLDYEKLVDGYERRYSTPEDRLIRILEELKTSSDQELLHDGLRQRL